jgi:hypothetical protein
MFPRSDHPCRCDNTALSRSGVPAYQGRMNQHTSMRRQIGTALAVLAIYLLTILAPMHQARASQLAFDALGYSTTQPGWALCASSGDIGHDGDVSVAKCPAAGIGKPAAIAPGLHTVALDNRASLQVALVAPATKGIVPAVMAPPSGPRGPPARS